MIHPRTFITEYVDPAIALWRKTPDVKHLAVHAITQVDVLAEMVALWTSQNVRQFRDDLGAREPALKIIRDAHNSHKHGALDRKTAVAASQGQRPETLTGYGYFADHWFLNDLPTRYNYLAFVQDDGTEKPVSIMLDEAMEAWKRELTRPGL
jgi:hypothetical protein